MVLYVHVLRGATYLPIYTRIHTHSLARTTITVTCNVSNYSRLTSVRQERFVFGDSVQSTRLKGERDDLRGARLRAIFTRQSVNAKLNGLVVHLLKPVVAADLGEKANIGQTELQTDALGVLVGVVRTLVEMGVADCCYETGSLDV